MSTLTPEEMELFGMAPPKAEAPVPADVPTRCNAGHSVGLRAPGTRVAIADCERCQELGIGVEERGEGIQDTANLPAEIRAALVLPPDAPASDPATPAPAKRGRKAKAVSAGPGHTVLVAPPVTEPVVYTSSQTPNLRDQFALAALNGLLASGVPQNETLASRAFAIADAMIAAR